MPIPCRVIALCLFLTSLGAMAGPADPLWLRAQETMRASRDLVAAEVGSQTIVTDEKGKSLDTITKTTKLSGWRDGEPVRGIVSKVEAQQTGLGEVKLESGVADHPEQALADGDSITRGGPAMLDGKACVLFHVKGMKGKRPFTSKVWIEEASGLPLRADYATEGLARGRSMSWSVLFGRVESAGWLPVTVKVDATMSALFYTFRVQSTQQLSNWVKRP
jgi:hypothetical protein